MVLCAMDGHGEVMAASMGPVLLFLWRRQPRLVSLLPAFSRWVRSTPYLLVDVVAGHVPGW